MSGAVGLRRFGLGPRLVLGVLLSLGLVAGSDAAERPGTRLHRIGFLSPLSFFYPWTWAAHLWLEERGYVWGKNVAFAHAYAEGTGERFAAAAAELVRRRVDVIVTSGTAATRALGRATRSVPIVMVTDDDPVRAGLVADLARPGGNITGVVARIPELSGKRLELLAEVVPGLRRVAVLWNPTDPDAREESTAILAASRTAGVSLQWLDVRRHEDVEAALRGADRERAGALLMLADNLTKHEAARVTRLAAERRLPAVYPSRSFVAMVPHRGLMAYGPSPVDLSRRLAVYVDKILKGARPGELPIERPSRYELVVSLATAADLRLRIPQSVLLRADEIIR